VSQQQAFIDCILDAPDDPTPRLVYADWLDEHGQELQAWRLRELEHRSQPWRGRKIDETINGYANAYLRLKVRKGNLLPIGLIASYRAVDRCGLFIWDLLGREEKSYLLSLIVQYPIWKISNTWFYQFRWDNQKILDAAKLLQSTRYLTNTPPLFDTIRLPRRFYHTQTPN
jgi:uncharacterized protein (TIGR02996 family)